MSWIAPSARGGVFTYDGDASQRDEGRAVVVDGSSIYVTGTSRHAAQTMAVWKLTEAGQLDTSFGGTGTGVFLTDNAAGGSTDIGLDLVVDGEGDLVVVGEARATDGFYSAATWKVR